MIIDFLHVGPRIGEIVVDYLAWGYLLFSFFSCLVSVEVLEVHPSSSSEARRAGIFTIFDPM